MHHVNGLGGEVDAGRICAVERHVKYRVGDGDRRIVIRIDTKLAFVCHQLTAGDVERSYRTDHAGMTGIAAGGVVGHADGEVFHRQFCTAHGSDTHAGSAIIVFRIINTDGLGLNDDRVLIRAVVGAADGRVSGDGNAVVGSDFAVIDAIFDFAGQHIEGQRAVDLHGQSRDSTLNDRIDGSGGERQILDRQCFGVGVVGSAAVPTGVCEIGGAELEIVDVQLIVRCCKYAHGYQGKQHTNG